MNKHIIVLADAGLSANFLSRLLNLSDKIQWSDNSKKENDIVSSNADDTKVNYCYTSNCHIAVDQLTSSEMASAIYINNRERLSNSYWQIIKQTSPLPSVWFFHELEEKIYSDPETVIVRVESGDNFNPIWFLDRRELVQGSLIQDDNTDLKSFIKNCCTSIKHQMNIRYQDGNFSIDSADIFNVTAVINLMKNLEIYHDGIEDIINRQIDHYIEKNTRPDGLFTYTPPSEYNFKDYVDSVQDPTIRHFLKCVNRKDLVEKNQFNDPFNNFVDFMDDIRNMKSYGLSEKKVVDNWKDVWEDITYNIEG